jgi:hypothetical protein
MCQLSRRQNLQKAVCRYISLVLFIVAMNVLSSYIVYKSVVYFEKSLSIYYPGYSYNDDYDVKRPEDEWVSLGI